MPSHVTSTFAVACLYAALKLIITAVLRRIGPMEFATASSSRQHRAVLYILSSINALLMIRHHLWVELPILWQQGRLFPDFLTSVRALDAQKRLQQSASAQGPMAVEVRTALTQIDNERQEHQRQAERLLLSVNGYLVHDLLALGPSGWRAYPLDLFHHLVGIGVVSNSLFRLEHTYPFCAMLLVSESSTLLLNGMWFCREFPTAVGNVVSKWGLKGALRSSTPAEAAKVLGETLLPRLFFLLFTYTRIFSMSVGFLQLNRTRIPIESCTEAEISRTANGSAVHVADRALGLPGKLVLGSITALQFYWYLFILKKLFATGQR